MGDSHQLAPGRACCFKVGVGCGFLPTDSCLRRTEPPSHGPMGDRHSSVFPALGSLGRSPAAHGTSGLRWASSHTPDAPSAPVLIPSSWQGAPEPPGSGSGSRILAAASAGTVLRTHSPRAAWTRSLHIPKPLILLLP